MEPLSFFVPGVPAPKGSMRARSVRTKGGKHRTVMTHDNEATEPWMVAVGWAGRQAMQGRSLWRNTALGVDVTFWLPRPSSHFTKGGSLRKSAPPFPHTKPDRDKLERCVWDALEGVVFDNDSRIVSGRSIKRWALGELGPGATVLIWAEVEWELREGVLCAK